MCQSLNGTFWEGIPGRGKCFHQGVWRRDRCWTFAFQHITVTSCTVWVYFQSPTQGLIVYNKLSSEPISRKSFSVYVTLHHFPGCIVTMRTPGSRAKSQEAALGWWGRMCDIFLSLLLFMLVPSLVSEVS